MISKTKGGKFVVKNEKGDKTLSKPLTLEGAEKRLKQIEYFKNRGKPAGGK